ncbi:MAG TPA: gfo/Idh/MocA family oxidoreductase, partial [Phycisphaerae bacterium]|nr:gfo/Idh/MocA family oxidoreductase [Phycisphaerae bacterium]
ILMPAGDWIAGGGAGFLDAPDESPPMDREPPMKDLDAKTAGDYVAFINYYIHQVNLMRHLLGEPYAVTYAEKSGVLMAVESKSGVAGIIEMTPYRTTIEWEESALVAFEKGYLLLRLPAPLAVNRAGTVEVYSDPGDGAVPERAFPTLPHVHAMRQQAMTFLKVCRGEMAPPCGAAEALEDLKVAREYVRLRFGR